MLEHMTADNTEGSFTLHSTFQHRKMKQFSLKTVLFFIISLLLLLLLSPFNTGEACVQGRKDIIIPKNSVLIGFFSLDEDISPKKNSFYCRTSSKSGTSAYLLIVSIRAERVHNYMMWKTHTRANMQLCLILIKTFHVCPALSSLLQTFGLGRG